MEYLCTPLQLSHEGLPSNQNLGKGLEAVHPELLIYALTPHRLVQVAAQFQIDQAQQWGRAVLGEKRQGQKE